MRNCIAPTTARDQQVIERYNIYIFSVYQQEVESGVDDGGAQEKIKAKFLMHSRLVQEMSIESIRIRLGSRLPAHNASLFPGHIHVPSTWIKTRPLQW